MGTWCGSDDPGNSHEPRSWGELLRAWFGNPKITMPPCVVSVPSREPGARSIITFPWQSYGTGPTITESEFDRRQAAAAARGEVELIDARIIPDREPEAGK
jgi:hypothetical protein